MTFQEAQTQFGQIVQSIRPGLSSAELLKKQTQLQNLLNALPNTAEFDCIAAAISEISPKLAGQITHAVLEDLQSRDECLREVTVLLDRVASQANSDARTLKFEQPKVIVSALTNTLEALQQIRESAKAGNVMETIKKAESLLVLLEQVRATIKSV